MTHSVYYMLDHPQKFLAEAYRVLRPGGRLVMIEPAITVGFPVRPLLRYPRAAPSLLTWSLVARAYNRFTPESLAVQLAAAGFVRGLGERVVEGYGILGRGEKPAESLPVPLAASERTPRYLYLLIQQTPNKPVWALTPGEPIHWEAATTLDSPSRLIAFSSLPKAVAFMQPAVTENRIIGVNKIAKYEGSEIERLGHPILLNPALNEVTRCAFLTVDANRAITGEE